MGLMARLIREEQGANLAEWGILVSLIAVIAILAITSVGESNSEMFSENWLGVPLGQEVLENNEREPPGSLSLCHFVEAATGDQL